MPDMNKTNMADLLTSDVGATVALFRITEEI